jgi:hypothetical protein
MEFSDDFDAIVEEGLLGLQGPTSISVLYDESIPKAMTRLTKATETLEENGAATALVVMPLLLNKDSSLPTPTSIRILGHTETLEIVKRQLGTVIRHVPELTGPAAYELIDSDVPWQDARARHIGDISRAYGAGQLSLFLGAGVSQSAGLPSWRGLLDRLMVDVVRHHFENKFPFTNKQETATASMLSAFSNDSPLISAHTISAILDRDYRSALRSALYPEAGGKESGLLNAIAQLCRPLRGMSGPRAVVTYNFDDLLERTLKAEKIPFRIIATEQARHFSQNILPVFHVHGMLLRSDSSTPDSDDPSRESKHSLLEPVLSENRYHDLYADAFSWPNLDQLELLRNTTCLFIGCSLTDPNQRRLLDIAFRTGRGMWHYGILQRRKILSAPDANELNPEVELVLHAHHRIQEVSFTKLGVRILWVEEHGEIPALLEQIRDSQGSLFRRD